MAGRPRKNEEQNWDGVIRHKRTAGPNGYKRWGCRCDECWEGGMKLRERERAKDKEYRQRMLAGGNFVHGITGYRQYGCRCEVCGPAGVQFNVERRGRPRTPMPSRPNPPVVNRNAEPLPDWDELAHLRPGSWREQRKSA